MFEFLVYVWMQVVVQKWIDSLIFKIINCFEDISFESFKEVYMEVYDMGCKGCIIYCLNDVIGLVLFVFESSEKILFEVLLIVGNDVDVIYMVEFLDCFVVFEGNIYKVKWLDSEYVLYIIVNDVVIVGYCCLFEVFINFKNMEYFVWIVVLICMILVVFCCGGDVFFVVEELKVVFDLCGGVWMKGKYVLLIFVVIGGVLEQYMVVIGFIEGEGMGLKVDF